MTNEKEQVEPELKTRLLPCPLFGHEPSKDEWPTGPYIAVSGAPNMPVFYAIVCPNCCSTAYDENKERVIKKWNTRVRVDSVAPRVDQQDNEEIRLALEGMIAAFDVSNYGDASIVATTRECALSIAKRAVGWTFASPAPKEEEARKVAIEILEWLNFDTSLDAVATDIYGVEAIIARHFCAPAPVVSDGDSDA